MLSSTSALPHLFRARCLQAMAEDAQPQTIDVERASVEVLHRFQISLKKEIIINSAFIADSIEENFLVEAKNDIQALFFH